MKEEKTCQFPAANNVCGQEKLALMVGGLAFLRLFIRLFRRNFVHLLPINQNVNAMKFIGIVPARDFSVFSCAESWALPGGQPIVRRVHKLVPGMLDGLHKPVGPVVCLYGNEMK